MKYEGRLLCEHKAFTDFNYFAYSQTKQDQFMIMCNKNGFFYCSEEQQ